MTKWLLIFSLMFTAHISPAEEAIESSEDSLDTVIAETTVDEGTPVTEEVVSEVEEAISDVEEVAVEPVVEPRTPTFVVIVPERIDHDWYWLLYSDRSQHIVQSAIEKALIRAGVEVIDLTTATLPSFGNDFRQLQTTGYAVKVGKQLHADYIVSGQATAVKASEGRAYGVNVVRTQAEVSVKIIRARDGRVLEVEDASVLEGGQSAQAAGQNALKKAGAQVGSKIARKARELAATGE